MSINGLSNTYKNLYIISVDGNTEERPPGVQ